MRWNVYTLFIFVLPLAILSLLLSTAHADIVTGNIELFEQTSDNKTTDATGLTSVTKARSFLQRYTVNYNNLIFPTINLWAKMRAEQQATNTDTDGTTGKVTDTKLMPSAGITYTTPFVLTGVSYDELDEKVEAGGQSVTTIRATKNAFLGIRPEGLPTLDLQYSGQRRYDREHVTLDSEDTLYTLSSMYRPVRSVQLNYNVAYDDNQNRLTLGETQSVLQSGRVGYGDQFFDKRLALNAIYNISHQELQSTRGSTSGGGGAILVQLFPLGGLSSISDTPAQNVMDVNQALIDGNLTVGSGINIGQLPSLTGDIRQRNVGVDFGFATEVSTLFIWVDRTLPSSVSNSFAWDIYTSQDNQNWSLYQTVFPAPFGLFDNRFEVSFPAVKTRYIKAVTRPLSVAVVPPPGVDVSNIFITELQAFDAQASAQAGATKKTTVVASDSVNLDGKLYIVRADRHSLMYDIYYQEGKSDQSGQPTARHSLLTNALIGSERFTNVFSGSAKILVQDENTNGTMSTYYDYEASLIAVGSSLPKLSHNLILTGKRERWDQTRETKDSGIISLGNTGEMYPGINLYLQGVETIVSDVTDTITRRTDNTLVSSGASIVPHRTVTINLNYDWSQGYQQGSTALALGTTITRRQSSGGNISYSPFSSLYLFGSYQRIEENDKAPVTYTSFSGSWSAQHRGGALEIRLIYTENAESESQTRSRLYGPYVKWKINSRTYIDASYTISTTTAPDQRNEVKAFNSSLRLYL